MASGFRDFSVTFISKVATLVLVVIIQSVLAWGLGPSGRGTYAVCFMFASLLQLVFSFGSDVAFTYFVASKKIKPAEAPAYLFLYAGFGSLFGLIIGYLLILIKPAFLAKADEPSLYLMLLLIPLLMLSIAFLKILTALEKYTLHGFLWIAKYSCELVLIVSSVFVFSQGVQGALVSKVVAEFITVAFIVVYLHSKYRLRFFIPKFIVLRDVASYGLRYYLGKLGNGINLQLGTFIAALFLSTDDIGIFAVAVAFMARLQIVPDALITVLLPKISKRQEGMERLVARCANLTAVFSFCIIVIIFIFAKPIVILLFSSAFLPVVNLLRIMAIGTLLLSYGKIFMPYIIGKNYPELVSKGVMLGVAFNIIIAYVFVPILGVGGAAIAMACSNIATAVIYILSYCHLSGLGIFETWRTIHNDLNAAKLAILQLCQINTKRKT